MKRTFTIFAIVAFFAFNLCVSGNAWALSAGNLIIVASGSSSTEPAAGWFDGLGKRGTTYTLSASAISALMDSNECDLTLEFDTIFISGNVVIDRSASAHKQFLTLRSNDFATGAIVFMNASSLTVKTATSQKSYLTLSSANINGNPQLTADQVTVSNVSKAYKRIEMNGFTKWKQWQIDSLLAHSQKIGDDIGNGAYDFTKNTKFTIDQHGVFTMTAQTDFLNGKKMGFKNMDRNGDLLPGDYSLGAYPDSFYVDLSNAEGIRFKVNVKGTAGSLNIGLSNCLKKGEWHEQCFEYYVYDIPFTAADKDGYITLPFSMFERVSWGSTWDLSKLIVFIMEVKNVTKNTEVSFSDVHGYTKTTALQPCLSVGNLTVNGELQFSAAGGKLRQLPGTAIKATRTGVSADGTVLLPNEGNNFGSEMDIYCPYAFVRMRSASDAPSTTVFKANSISRYTVYKVWADQVDKGVQYNYSFALKDTLTHTYELAYTNSYFSLSAAHEQGVCRSEKAQLVATGLEKSSQYHWFTETSDIAYTDTLNLDVFPSEGKYRYFVECDTLIKDVRFSLGRSVLVEVYPEYALNDTLELCETALPYQWKDTLFAKGSQSGSVVFARRSIHGCDSTTTLYLNIHPAQVLSFTDSICEGEAYQKNGFSLSADQTAGKTLVTDTLNLKDAFGCDSIRCLQLTVFPHSLTELSDTIKKGTSYQANGFDISGTEIGTADFTDTLSNMYGCDSVVVLHLTTIINDAVKEALPENMSIYPNPTRGNVVLEQRDVQQANRIFIMDAVGRVLKRVEVSDAREEISLRPFPAGIYYLGIYQDSRMIGVVRICKE